MSMLRQIIPVSLMLAIASVASAQSSIERVEPRVARAELGKVLARLAIDDDQRLITDMLYADYAVALVRLAERATQRAEDAGRQRVEDALSGRVFLDPDELRRLRVAVTRADLESWEEADRLARGLLDDTRLSFDPETAAVYDDAVRGVRRSMYLAPHRAREHDDAYAGDGIDVIVLVDAASAPGGELEAIDPARFAVVLDRYADRIDQHLRDTAADARRSEAALAIARIERNEGARRSEEQAAVSRWREQFDITRSATEAVAAIAREAAGAAAETRWRDRVEAALFPRLFAPGSAEKTYAWIESRVDDPDVQAQARTFHDDFTRRDRTLRQEASGLMLRGRLERGVIVHSRMDPVSIADPGVRDLYQSLLKNSGRRAALDAETAGALEGLLTERQRKQMRADIAASAYGRRRR